MKDTIKGNFEVHGVRNIFTGERYKGVYKDGELIFTATPRTMEDYLDERDGNEMFDLCEVFTTISGERYIYWRDEEIDEDYLTKLV